MILQIYTHIQYTYIMQKENSYTKMKRLWFSQGQKVLCVCFCFLANSPIIMNSCRSKSDCRRGNMGLTMTFRTVTITTTTTKLDEENDDADTTTRRAKRFILENVQIRTRSIHIIISTMTKMSRASSGIVYISTYVAMSIIYLAVAATTSGPDRPTDKCRSRMSAIAIIHGRIVQVRSLKSSCACV